MRKNLLLFVCAFATLMLFTTACKKDSKSPQEMILGKWTYKTLSYKSSDGTNANEQSHDMSASGDYLEFKSDGTMIARLGGFAETLDYTLRDGTTLIFGGETYTLSTLTEKKFTIYTKVINPDYVFEEWREFVK